MYGDGAIRRRGPDNCMGGRRECRYGWEKSIVFRFTALKLSQFASQALYADSFFASGRHAHPHHHISHSCPTCPPATPPNKPSNLQPHLPPYAPPPDPRRRLHNNNCLPLPDTPPHPTCPHLLLPLLGPLPTLPLPCHRRLRRADLPLRHHRLGLQENADEHDWRGKKRGV